MVCSNRYAAGFYELLCKAIRESDLELSQLDQAIESLKKEAHAFDKESYMTIYRSMTGRVGRAVNGVSIRVDEEQRLFVGATD